MYLVLLQNDSRLSRWLVDGDLVHFGVFTLNKEKQLLLNFCQKKDFCERNFFDNKNRVKRDFEEKR